MLVEIINESNIMNDIINKIKQRNFIDVFDNMKKIYEDYIAGRLVIVDKYELSKFKQVLIILTFFPELNYFENSIEFINHMIYLSFNNILNNIENPSLSNINQKNKFFFELFSKSNLEWVINIDNFSDSLENNLLEKTDTLKEYLMERIEIDESLQTIDNIYLIRDLTILNFIFHYKLNFNQVKDKIFTISDSFNLKNKAKYEEFLQLVDYYQESFKSYFSFTKLIIYVRQILSQRSYSINSTSYSNKLTFLKLENLILCQQSDVDKFFTFTRNDMKSNIQMNYITYKQYGNDVINLLNMISSENSIYENWKKLFIKNKLLTSLITIRHLKNMKNKENIQEMIKEFNYNDIFLVYECIKDIQRQPLLQSQPRSGSGSKCGSKSNESNLIRIYLDCISIYYLIFNTDMNSFGNLLANKGDLNSNINNTNILILLWNIKVEFNEMFILIKESIEKLMNDIFLNKEETAIYLFNNYFEEEMIKFILENIESSHVSSKFIDDYILSKESDKILNGFLLLGYWANTYPIKYIYNRILDILFIIKKNVDLRTVLTSEEKISKFIKGIYLIFKAFPKLNEDQLNFVNYLKENVNYWISDYNLKNYAMKSLDRANYFIEKVLINSNFINKNTLFFNIKNLK